MNIRYQPPAKRIEISRETLYSFICPVCHEKRKERSDDPSARKAIYPRPGGGERGHIPRDEPAHDRSSRKRLPGPVRGHPTETPEAPLHQQSRLHFYVVGLGRDG